ncbi:carbohydrate ABC transporter permease [Homoserinibacter sp. YIM 151385]|uniref:carbohydrate ABC transporter permease n=1 Tax=Homoserinibacter sp. YIM 151385 TaxID=2985506 RepID=UPI003FA59D27
MSGVQTGPGVFAGARPGRARPARDARRRGGEAAARRRDGAWPWLFVLPLFTGIAVFYLVPIAQTLFYSFTEWGVFGGWTFAGLDNYARLLSGRELLPALGNTLLYTGIVLLGIPIAVWLASLLNTPGLRFASLYRVLFFLPYIAMPTAVAMVWRMIFNGDYGIVNWLLSLVGIDGPYWISTPGIAMGAVAVVGLWSSIGFALIVLRAGLKNIPEELYEAAEIDGASPWRRFRAITVPLLTPSIFFVLVITIISSFQLFDLLYAILGSRNPILPKSMSLVFLFYQAGFVDGEKGFAAAVAMFILVLIGLVTLVQFRLQRRWVHE